jgi:hypothetical protein
MRFFLTHPELEQEAVDHLQRLGGHARRLLANCVETQGLRRAAVSEAARSLQDLGYVRIAEDGVEGGVTIAPTLEGEEALEAWEAAAKPVLAPSSNSVVRPR